MLYSALRVKQDFNLLGETCCFFGYPRLCLVGEKSDRKGKKRVVKKTRGWQVICLFGKKERGRYEKEHPSKIIPQET